MQIFVMSSSQSHYIRSRGKVLGPFSVEQMEKLRDRGQLRSFHEVSADRLTWMKAASLTELFPPEVPPSLAAANVSRALDTSAGFPTSQSQAGEYPGAGIANDSVRDGWRRVRTGVGFVLLANYISLGGYAILLVGTMLLWVAGALAFQNARSSSDGAESMISMGVGVLFLGVIWALAQAAATILQLVGHGFCMAVAPRRNSGVKGLAITVFVLAATALVLSLLTRMVGVAALSGMSRHSEDAVLFAVLFFLTGGPLRWFIVYPLDAATFCLLLFFLRSVATALRKKNLARSVVALLASWGGLLVVAGILFFFLLLAVSSHLGRLEDQFRVLGGFTLFLLTILSCIGVALYAWFLVVLHQTRNALNPYLSESHV